MDVFKPFGLRPLPIMALVALAALSISIMGLPVSQAGGNGTIKISSQTQSYQLNEGHSQFDGNVKIAMEGTQISSPHADIEMDGNGKPATAVFTNGSKMVRKEGKLEQTIQAGTLRMGIENGKLNAQGGVTTKLSGDPEMGDISIASDTQEFNPEKNTMKAMGHVRVTKGDMIATSPEALIFTNANGQADKAIFTKGAKLIQGEQEIVGETITIKIDTGMIVAERQTQSLLMGKDQATGKMTRINIKAHTQELDRQNGTLIANGNTQILYEDYTAKGPKAVIYRANNQLDKIVISGQKGSSERPQVEDTERRVSGDTVIITVKPKQFNAQGNVTTFIKAKKQQTASATNPANAKKSPIITGNAAKGVKSAAEAPVPVKPDNTAWEQEEMIEQMSKGQEKAQ